MMTEFNGVVPALADALGKRGYESLTPVQVAMLAPELEHADLLVSAQTGSGKTVAFGLAIAPTLLDGAEKLPAGGAPLALVVAPTRELALQVKRELDWLYAPAGASVASCVGGMDFRDERRALSHGAHIVVGTPGRLVDHISRGSLDMSALRAVIMDEADEMLDLGFREELETILAAAPAERRTLMFSATVSKSISTLARNYQRDAIRINTASDSKQHLDIDYRALNVAPRDAENGIINLLRYHEAENAIVFCGTRANVNHLVSRLSNRGFSVVALSGELTQKERSHALQAMRDGRARVCVATDVAARGIDLPGLELVIHADLPKNTESLLHRSGRTGRAGRKGVSALIVPFKARRRIERLLRDAKIDATWEAPPSATDVEKRDDERLMEALSQAEAINEREAGMVKALVSRFSAEELAAAYLRMHRSGKSAPEELSDAPDDSAQEGRGRRDRDGREPRKPRSREDFKNGVWVTLSVGRKASAEPRWLLPMLCKAGGLDRGSIGSIRIAEHATHVEISQDVVEQFFQEIGPGGKLEKSITVTRADGPPTPEPRREYAPRDRADAPRHSRSGPRSGSGRERESAYSPESDISDVRGKKKRTPYKPKSESGHENRSSEWRADSETGDRPARPAGKPAYKSKSGPGGKPRSAFKTGGKTGSAAPKKRKPKPHAG